MNIFSVIGFIIGGAVLFMGLRLASEDVGMFWDGPSLFIVAGGTFASTAISFQLNRMFTLLKIFLRRMIKGKKFKIDKTIEEMMQIGDAYRKGEALQALADKTNDMFLKEGLEMLNEGVIDADDVVRIMNDRNDNMMFNNMEEANKIKTAGKFPPAFGMIGTTIGMIVLLANLGGEDAMKMIGPAMGVCLITTLYGSVIANLSFVPISENLMDDTKEVYLKNRIIVAGLGLLIKKTNPIIMAEELNSYVNPHLRLDWKKALGQG